MADDANDLSGRPAILLGFLKELPDDIETDFRAALGDPRINLQIIRRAWGPFAGVELYLPTAIALFVTAGFFNGVLQEAGKDVYIGLKRAASALWRRAAGLGVSMMTSAGKTSSIQRYSLAFSITGEVTPSLSFKFLIQTELDPETAEAGITAFLDLIHDLLNDQVDEEDVNALLTYQPVGGIVLVTFDAASAKIIPVNAFEGRLRSKDVR